MDWEELIPTAGGPPPQAEPETPEQGRFARLRERLSKSRQALRAEISASLFDRLDAETWERLEEALILADVGAKSTAEIVGRLEAEVEEGTVGGPEAIRERLVELLAEHAAAEAPQLDLTAKPTVIMVVGVNGTGKTTTIGKLAWHLRQQLGHSVLIGAADTYRAAAVEQLERWAQRAGCDIVTGGEGQDPGSVAFDAIAAGTARGVDVIIIDTAGRLHTQEQLMAELGKVARVIGRKLEGAPHEVLLTVDATTGQNGVRQARLFSEVVDVTGIVLTKLDGTAKGGIALAIADELGLPVKLIGTGEQLEDLRPFDPPEFARALVQ